MHENINVWMIEWLDGEMFDGAMEICIEISNFSQVH